MEIALQKIDTQLQEQLTLQAQKIAVQLQAKKNAQLEAEKPAR